MSDKLKTRYKVALNNVRELESAVFAFWMCAQRCEMKQEELTCLLSVTSNLVDSVVTSIEAWGEEEGLSNG